MFSPINNQYQSVINRTPLLAVTTEVDETHEENQSHRGIGIKSRFKIFAEDQDINIPEHYNIGVVGQFMNARPAHQLKPKIVVKIGSPKIEKPKAPPKNEVEEYF